MTVAGLVDELQKRGPRVILTLDDRTGRIEVTLFEEQFQQHRDLLAKDALVLVEGMLRFDEFSDAWRSRRQQDPSELEQGCASRKRRRLVIKCTHGKVPALALERARRHRWRRGAAVRARSPLQYLRHAGRAARSRSVANGSVRASRELLEQLEALVGRGSSRRSCYGAPSASA